MKTQKPFLYAFAVTLGILTATVAVAWTGPSAAPPGSNASAPLNASATAQSKAAGLILNTGGASTGLVVYGNVGIGTANPIRALTVAGETSLIPTGGGVGVAYLNISDVSGNGGGSLVIRGLASNGSVETSLTTLTLNAASTYLTGNVRIGASSIADAPLRITFNDGTGGVTGIHIQNTNGGANAYSGVYYFSNTDTVSGSVFQGFNNSTHEFRFNNVATTPSLNFMTGSVSRIYVNSSGNVGVGTVTPGQKLDVNGNVRATDICTTAGKCLSAAPTGGLVFGGMYTIYTSNSACEYQNAFTGSCSCPSYAPSSRAAAIADSGVSNQPLQIFYCTN